MATQHYMPHGLSCPQRLENSASIGFRGWHLVPAPFPGTPAHGTSSARQKQESMEGAILPGNTLRNPCILSASCSRLHATCERTIIMASCGRIFAPSINTALRIAARGALGAQRQQRSFHNVHEHEAARRLCPRAAFTEGVQTSAAPGLTKLVGPPPPQPALRAACCGRSCLGRQGAPTLHDTCGPGFRPKKKAPKSRHDQVHPQ